MDIFEFEGYKILQGIKISFAKVYENEEYVFPVMVKGQVLESSRFKKGYIKKVTSKKELKDFVKELLKKGVKKHIVQEFISFEKEYFISITYSGVSAKYLLSYSVNGGIHIEEEGGVSIIEFVDVEEVFKKNSDLIFLKEIIEKLFNAFKKYDMEFIEINPLVKTSKGFVALDVKGSIDTKALYRQDFKDVDRDSYFFTKREKLAREIDSNDYRGVAGSSYTDMSGSLALLASGGGASLIAMDALFERNLIPANYVEFSGNPSMQKVYDLSKIVLSKKGLRGLWIVGGRANFTDVLESTKGIIKALKEVGFDKKIFWRRDGPNSKQAVELLKKFCEENNIFLKIYSMNLPISKVAILISKEMESSV